MSAEDTAPLMVAPFRLDSLPAPTTPAPPAPNRRGRHAVPTHRRRRRLVLVVLLVLAVGAGTFAGVRLSAPDTPPQVTPVLTSAVLVPDKSVSLPWPDSGQGAVAIPTLGVSTNSGPEQPVSVASLTKLMTAYVIVHDHPLALGEQGPMVSVTPTDIADYDDDAAENNSSVLVAPGEQLSEAQLLGGLLVHSADNFADLLARWDAGSIPAFVDKMNADAARLGMTQSHFADASGVDGMSRSTASDILKVAAQDMENPVIASFVRMPAITLPVAGTVSTYTPLVGLFGVVGVKSGFSSTAGGCDVLAEAREVGGKPVLLLAAVTGQAGMEVLAQAGLHALALVSAMEPLVGSLQVVRHGQLVARVAEGGRSVGAAAASSATVLTWPGLTARREYRPARHLTDEMRQGAGVGTVTVTMGDQQVVVPVRLERHVPPESLLQRLF